jgi:hypothetical protein
LLLLLLLFLFPLHQHRQIRTIDTCFIIGFIPKILVIESNLIELHRGNRLNIERSFFVRDSTNSSTNSHQYTIIFPMMRRIVSLVLFLTTSATSLVQATVYILDSNSNRNETFASLPGLFGAVMNVSTSYHAHVQFFPQNPNLCDMTPTTILVEPFSNSNLPVAILAARGQCAFERKAQVAEQLGSSVAFLLVYNTDVGADENALVPMYSEFGDTRLALLSVSHRAGQAIKQRIYAASSTIKSEGGPVLELDAQPPEGLLTADDVRSMLLSALGLFFMLLSFSACVMIVAGTRGSLIAESNPAFSTGRRLLTEAEVQQFLMGEAAVHSEAGHHESPSGTIRVGVDGAPIRNPTATVRDSTSETKLATIPNSSNNEEYHHSHSCAVCFDDFNEQSLITVLPCQHKFHFDCILPWLTERQSKCPLCKYNVMEYVRAKQSEQGTSPAASFWERIQRRRWTAIVTHELEERRASGRVISAEEMEEELELTEQQLERTSVWRVRSTAALLVYNLIE